MRPSVVKGLVLAIAMCLTGATLSAQGVNSTLSGVVTDADGGALVAAVVVVKSTATGVSTTTATNGKGAFVVPSIDPGDYTVTVSLAGFKTAVVKNVVLLVGTPGSINVKLELGKIEDAVEIRGGTELIQTQSTAVSSTINAKQIESLPLTSRNVLFGFVTLLPGVDTPGAPRDSKLFGLPEESINITINGINTNNNFQRDTDGFYSMVFPQLDAIEQVTLTGAAAGADSASGGSVAIKFVTKSGTNRYLGTVYDSIRRPSFNTNDYFSQVKNLPKTQIELNQYGASLGGPIRIPKLFDGAGRAFFFVNHEEFHQPTSTPLRTRQLLNPGAQSGVFRYTTTGGAQEINLLALAAANGQTSTIDPIMSALLAEMRARAQSAVTSGFGLISDQNNVNLQQFDYKDPGQYVSHFPTVRLDFNLNARNRLTGTYIWQEINRFPDIQNSTEPQYPGLPNYGNYLSYRTTGSITLASTLSSSVVNEAIAGWQWSPGTFNAGVTASMFDNQGGFSLGFPTLSGTDVTPASRTTNPNTRHQANIDFKDTINLLKGNHSMSFGGGFTRTTQANDSFTVVPSIGFGIQTGLDPADTMFTTANFPGASNGNLNDARAVYALLTGRVTAVNGTSRVNENTNKYEYLAPDIQRVFQDEYSVFLQDSWRMKPTFTVNYGLAWLVQTPVRAANDLFSTTDYAGFCGPYGIGANGKCNLFQVGGPQTGVVPTFVQYTAGTKGYNTDWNNLAPNMGVAWRPNAQSRFGRMIFGDPEQAVIRAAFSVGFNKPSEGTFTGLYANNPGRSINTNRNNNSGSSFLLVNQGESWPVLFRDTARLGPPSNIPDAPVYPILATTGSSLSIFDPNIEVPYTQSFSVGLQRSLGKDMAIELRYVGTRGQKLWTTENWNETNLIENGFLNEFKVAQSNLRATVQAGLCAVASTCTFGYRGPGTGTQPLPIYLAYLTGSPDSSNPAVYATAAATTAFTNTTLLGRFDPFQPNPTGSAQTDLQTTARIANAVAAGYPTNFFRMNPAIGTNADNLTTSGGRSRYDSVVFELRRRLSRGLQVTGNFTHSWAWGEARNTLRESRFFVPSTNNVPNAFKMTVNWDIPVGRERRFGSNMGPWMNGLIGGWAFNMKGFVQSGTQLTVTGARLVGMTEAELQDAYQIRIVKDPNTGVTTVYELPDDIILNTRRAFNTSSTTLDGFSTALGAPEGRYIAPAGSFDCFQLYAGDCAKRNIYVRGPVSTRFDINVRKQLDVFKRVKFQLTVDVLNVFNAINFNPVFNPGSGSGIMQVTSSYQDVSGTYDPGGRLVQVGWRFNW